MINILVPATDPSRIETIARLARAIWTDHYVPVIGKEQTDYMLDRFQSAEAIRSQIELESVLYFLIAPDGQPAGYVAVQPRENDLFLSKFYIEKSRRGQGLGKAALRRIEQMAEELHKPAITLTVNRRNSSSIAAYSRFGFRITDRIVTDIGDGFAMDDYIMQKRTP